MLHSSSCVFLASLVFGFAGFFPGTHIAVAAEPSAPNVVLIIGDDQAWTDYGFMGHKTIQTPNLDRLASRSLIFERGYVSSPLCRPSLASMVTGLFPSQHGTTGNDVDGRNNRHQLDVPLREQFHQHPSIVRSLTSKGYLAHQSGKWWEGSFSDGGFTHGMTHGIPARGGRHGDAGLKIGRQGMKPVLDFVDNAVTEKTPFLLWYAPFLPHTPHNPPERLLKKYRSDDRAIDVAKYFAMCEWFDETCGQLLDHLQTRGVRDNTLVIFVCDNGWVARSENADDPNQDSWPDFSLRSKGSPYENGIRTPILVSWPEKIQHQRVDSLAHAIDIFPTIASATGVETPQACQGVNLLDPVSVKARKQVFGVTHSIHNMTVGNPEDTLQYLWCVQGRWKLIKRFDGKDTTRYKKVHDWDRAPLHLYDLANDPSESKDLAESHPEVTETLVKQIEEWRASLN